MSIQFLCESESVRSLILFLFVLFAFLFSSHIIEMAVRPCSSIFIALSLLLLVTFSNVAEAYGNASLRPSDCKPKCTYRCSATSHKKPCMFFCQKCCAKCLCVPPGTYGNRQVCPCYNSWKTKEGGPKCP